MKTRRFKVKANIVLIMFLLFSFLSCATTEPSHGIADPIENESAPLSKQENLLVYGSPDILEEEQSEWVYYYRTVQRDFGTDMLHKGFRYLCKMKNDGSGGEVVLSKEVNPETIIVSEDWLYFRDLRYLKPPTGPLKRIRNDGTNLTNLTIDDIDFFSIHEDWTYFTCPHNYTLMRMKKDGSEKTELLVSQLEARVVAIHFMDDWAYIATGYWPYGYPFDSKPLYRANFTEDASAELLIDNAIEVQIRGNWIYYLSGENNLMLFRTSLDGSITEQLSNDQIKQFIVTRPGYLYYLALDQQTLTRIQVNTLEQEVMPSIPLHDSPRLNKEIRGGILFSTYESLKTPEDGKFGISRYFHLSHTLEMKEISFEADPSILTHDWAYFMVTDPETGMDEYLKAVKLDEYFKK